MWRREEFRRADENLALRIAADEARRAKYEAAVARHNEVVRLRGEGLTWKAIGKRVGLTHQGAHRSFHNPPPVTLRPRQKSRYTPGRFRQDFSWRPTP